ncbi:DsrE family protein [Sinomonas sp.]|uniref:DsrE family protein n=1 Tax=Sinomonas sp. TaxID=1914986 RepID=UPI002FDF80A6
MAPEEGKGAGGGSQGTVVHLDDADAGAHERALRNVGNLLDALDDGSPVELVVHGPAIAAVVRGAGSAESLQALLGRGVGVAACQNTMDREGIRAQDLAEGVHTVPSGIAQLVLRQRQGWAYVRP